MRGHARFAVAVPSTFNEVFRRRDAVDRVTGDEWIEAPPALYKTTTERRLTILARKLSIIVVPVML